jgi:hypothetical protein
MSSSRYSVRVASALAITAAMSVLLAGVVRAHPESEGTHGSSCIVTAEPGTVPDGGQFTVSGNFDRASIFIVPGRNTQPAENAIPDATTPAGASSFSVTFTAQGQGDITVVAGIPETECGDSDVVTITGTVPNTAMTPAWRAELIAGIVLLVLAALAFVARQRVNGEAASRAIVKGRARSTPAKFS